MTYISKLDVVMKLNTFTNRNIFYTSFDRFDKTQQFVLK